MLSALREDLQIFEGAGDYLNMVIISGLLAYMGLLFVHDRATNRPSALLASQHKSTAFAFWLYFAGLACLLAEYVLLLVGSSLDHPSFLQHATLHVAEYVVGNLASACWLVAAFAYRTGKDFKYRNAIEWVAIFAFIILIWAALFEFLRHTDSLLLTTIEVSPTVVAANIAMMALGWSFFARWGSTALPFLILTFLYAMFQLPANLAGELEPLGIGTSALQVCFPILAFGKILITYGFLVLLCSSVLPQIEIDKARYWPPAEQLRPQRWLLPQIGGALGSGLVHAVLLAFVAAVLIELFRVLLQTWR